MLEKNGRLWKLTNQIDGQLELAILRLLGSRGPGATLSLREAALAVGAESWGSLIERAHFVASRLAARGFVEVVRPSPEADWSDPGSVRVRLKRRRLPQVLPPSLLN